MCTIFVCKCMVVRTHFCWFNCNVPGCSNCSNSHRVQELRALQQLLQLALTAAYLAVVRINSCRPVGCHQQQQEAPEVRAVHYFCRVKVKPPTKTKPTHGTFGGIDKIFS